MSEYVRVPRAPTVEMIAATVDAVFGGAIEDASIIAEVYSAMVEAATAGQEPTDADRDYADMRRMQAALIAKTHECNELRALAAEQAQPEASANERRLRRLLCFVKHGRSAYMDDGEASDCSAHPSIDYLRDSLDEIEAKWRQRAAAAARGR